MASSRAEPVGLLGGTFDPVHYGHLRTADALQRGLDVADMRLVPAGDPPHRGAPHANAAHRVAMLELARAEFPRLAIDTREIGRHGKSYTVMTLESLRAEAPARPLLWIVGADAFLGLPAWHRWDELFDLAHIVVVNRPGALDGAMPSALAAQWRARATNDREALRAAPSGAIYTVDPTPQPISATAIRAELARGPDGIAAVRGLLPAGVLSYIARNRLYGASPLPQDAT